MKKKIIDHLFFFVTNKCNSSCKFCFDYLNNIDESAILNLDEIRKISGKIGSLKTISFSGGEPFLRDDLADICKTFYDNSHFKAASIPTNALLPQKVLQGAKEIVSYCKKSLIVIELPLDSISSRYDEIRGVDGGFDKLKETYSLLRTLVAENKNLHIKFNITYSYYNKNSIPDILKESKKIFGKNLDYSLGLVHGSTRNEISGNIELEDYFCTFEIIEKMHECASIRDRFLKSFRRIVKDEFKRRLLWKKSYVKCLAGEKFVVLFPDGNLYPCEPLINICIGNLREHDYDLKKVLLSKNNYKNGLPDRSNCICDWECGISRSMMSDKVSIIKSLVSEFTGCFRKKRLYM